jgi:hypothetical protein
MKTAWMALLGATALFAIAGSSPARAAYVDDYRWDQQYFAPSECRVIETRTTNRWGEDVTVRRRVCG